MACFSYKHINAIIAYRITSKIGKLNKKNGSLTNPVETLRGHFKCPRNLVQISGALEVTR